MDYGRYTFTCRFESDAELPYYKGSTFRGVFGRALKKTVCALRRKTCDNCLLNATCLYAQVFELSASDNLKTESTKGALPHPFVIEPPATTKTRFSAGDIFDFHLLLFGVVNQSLPYFVYALDQMGKAGIGKRINGSGGKYLLTQVSLGDTVIYTVADQKLKMPTGFETLSLRLPEQSSCDETTLKVILETPLRLKFDNRLKADLPFHVLVRAMLRRVSSLMESYGDGEPALDYKGLVKRAMEINTVENNVEWFDWRRYSFRQDQAMLMGGMVGSIVYEGELAEFLPLVGFCKKVHLGKQTTFGLGGIRVEE